MSKRLDHLFLMCYIINLPRTAAIIKSKTRSAIVVPEKAYKMIERTISQPKAEVKRSTSCFPHSDLNIDL